MHTNDSLLSAIGARLGAPLIVLAASGCAMPVEDGQAETNVHESSVHEDIRIELPFYEDMPMDSVLLEEGAVCGETTPGACEEGTFCKMPQGACLHVFPPPSGRCTPIPEACSTELEPVCGCDGVTYGNACRAHQSGQSVAGEGFCAPAGKGEDCGTGLLEPHCESGLYCKRPEGACLDPSVVGTLGTCEVVPTWCSQQWDPVCGCDGNTYGNDCTAAAHGVSIAYRAACAPEL